MNYLSSYDSSHIIGHFNGKYSDLYHDPHDGEVLLDTSGELV